MSSCAPGSDTYSAPRPNYFVGGPARLLEAASRCSKLICCTFAKYSTLSSLYNIPRTTKKGNLVILYIGRAKKRENEQPRTNDPRQSLIVYSSLVTKYGNCTAFYPGL